MTILSTATSSEELLPSFASNTNISDQLPTPRQQRRITRQAARALCHDILDCCLHILLLLCGEKKEDHCVVAL
ncbi:hypothetical protein GOP47_0003869 [Adiantum capillus-veneris]|uniref:Uncharacterized protein n=1 Tax=Adiantum capillus-veneris TaxID=13818 RepID=A0A9D4V6F5_ADICA|nr:hypothetical protein GOP47_0003869 [Adiantum capillus-veneris]